MITQAELDALTDRLGLPRTIEGEALSDLARMVTVLLDRIERLEDELL